MPRPHPPGHHLTNALGFSRLQLFDAPHDPSHDSHLESATPLASASHQNGAGASGAPALKHEVVDTRIFDSLPRKPMQSQSQTQPSAILEIGRAHV